MRGRILINLTAFAVLGVVLWVWALTSLITVDALRRPFAVTAEFSASPGLRADLEVAYLGVTVGSVRTVRLGPGRVVVGLRLDRGVSVPSDARAAVLRKSAIGEPYIELSPAEAPAVGRQRGAPARPLRDGDRIPLSRTRVAVDYRHLFQGADRLLSAVPSGDVKTIVHELATGVNGRGETLRDLLGDVHQLTGTLTDNARLLDDLSVRVTRLTGVLADTGPQLAGGLDSLAAFTGELDRRRATLDKILDNGPQFLGRTRQLIESARPGLSCLLDAMGAPGPPVFDAAAGAALDHALGIFATKIPQILPDVTMQTKFGLYGRTSLVITADSTPAAREFAAPHTLPRPPSLYFCTKAYKSAAELRAAAGGSGGTGRAGEVTGTAPVTAGAFTRMQAPLASAATPVARTSAPDRLLPLVPVLAAAVVFAVTAWRTTRVVRGLSR